LPTPLERLQASNISSTSKNIILGDSVIRPVNSEDIFDNPSSSQKICIPGLSVLDLDQWLSCEQNYENTENLFVHLGVNSCRQKSINMKDWGKVIEQTKKSFPYAEVHMSSIIPPRGPHSLKKLAQATNASLSAACFKHQVKFINNDKWFTISNGSPRRSLYRDCIHINQKGAYVLASSWKYAL